MEKYSTLLEIRDLKITFPQKKSPVHAVRGVSFSIEKGKTLGIVGKSGSGKSTIARAVMQLVQPTSGKILFDGVDLADRCIKKRMQMIFQDPGGSLNPYLKAGSIVSAPLLVHKLAKGKELVRLADSYLSKLVCKRKTGRGTHTNFLEVKSNALQSQGQ